MNGVHENMMKQIKLIYEGLEYANINHMMNDMIKNHMTAIEVKSFLKKMYEFSNSELDTIIAVYHIEERIKDI
jgi:hypothetical protein